MGAGASSGGSELEELVACTFLLGQALASMQFPDMHRIEEFGDEGNDEDGFVVSTSHGSRVLLKNVAYANEDGWTALHACCHNHECVEAALAILRKENAPIEAKTKRGPGAYNSGWTALHMACAYGIEPIAKALVEKGADVECVNSAQWTPLLECCHRGFASLVAVLLPKVRQLARIPDDSKSTVSPFARPPSQSCLGEACRCGFKEIASMLLDAGAPKDLQNAIGWTPLHEACFHNHVECVKVLMVYGADPAIRDKHQVVPYDVAMQVETRQLVKDLGGGPSSQDHPLKSAHKEQEPEQVDERTSDDSAAFLHRGEKLGDLPALGSSSKKLSTAAACRGRPQPSLQPSPLSLNKAPEDAPSEFLCEISHRLLTEPVRTPYGNVFEAKIIAAWFAKNGSICPLTGQPLVSSELLPDKELQAKITKWQVAKSLDSIEKEKSDEHDDIYDF